MDSQSLRAQTPPLAGEWAVSKGSKSESIINGSSSLVQSQGPNTIQSSSFQSSGSSTFQSSSIQASKAFEAFPGMGGIENLKLEEGDH